MALIINNNYQSVENKCTGFSQYFSLALPESFLAMLPIEKGQESRILVNALENHLILSRDILQLLQATSTSHCRRDRIKQLE